MLHTNFMALFYRTGVIADGSFTLRQEGFSNFFCSCDLDLNRMTFIHELDPYSLEIYGMCKNKFPTLNAFETCDKHTLPTDRQTDIHDRNSRVVSQKSLD